MISRSHRRVADSLCVLLGLAVVLGAHAEDVDDKARKLGLKKAPELVLSAKLNCTITDARKIPARAAGNQSNGLAGGFSAVNNIASPTGNNGGGGGGGSPPPGGGGDDQGGSGAPAGGANRGPATPEEYEVACGEGLGYVLTAGQRNQPATGYLCIEALDGAGGPGSPGPNAPRRSGPPGAGAGSPPPANLIQCALPANAEGAQHAALAQYVTKAGVHCGIQRARGIGHSASNTLLEVACSEGTGYVLAAPYPLNTSGAVQATPCLAIPDNASVSCQLSDRMAQINAVDALMRATEASCQIRDRRFMTLANNGDGFYEFSCQDGNGYVLRATADGKAVGAISCKEPAVASALGGCKLVQ